MNKQRSILNNILNQVPGTHLPKTSALLKIIHARNPRQEAIDALAKIFKEYKNVPVLFVVRRIGAFPAGAGNPAGRFAADCFSAG